MYGSSRRSDFEIIEDEIDVTIRVLMRAGAYNDWLRWAYEAGVDIRGA